jgi:hypothetical protein
MSRVSALTHNAPCLYAPEPVASIFDDVDCVRDVLNGSGIPDYLACALADVAVAGWTPEAWMDALRDVRRHVQPILSRADA